MKDSVKENQIAPTKIRALANGEDSAKAVKLVYVSDQQPGISRVRKGKKKFEYFLKGKKVRNKEALTRIKKLVIPPAWENVWICTKPNGHLQVTGYDIKNRKQYKYHPLWSAVRNETKFYRLTEFGKVLPVIRSQLDKDLALPGMPKKKVLAAIVRITDRTGIRLGNGSYEKLYGSFGLSTMKDRHVKVNGHTARFMFKGKKGVYHDVSLNSRRLAKIIKQCRDIPGRELFQYYDDEGSRQSVDSGDVNEYIRELTKQEFTSKDFRTWIGTVQCLHALQEIGLGENETQIKHNLVTALDKVAASLGNTRSICKKHYVHPLIISCYESERFSKYVHSLNKINGNESGTIEICEKVLIKMLEAES